MNMLDEPDPLCERPELDFSKGVHGKYAQAAREGSNIVMMDDDLLDTFPNAASVNDVLRQLKQLARSLPLQHSNA